MARPFADAFVLTYRGHDFVRQWVETCDTLPTDLICARFYWETDWTVLGGRKTSGGALLYLDVNGGATRYEAVSPDSTLKTADFDPDGTRITLRDGTTHVLELPDRPALVFQNNIVLLLATALRCRDVRRGTVKEWCFLPDGLRSRLIALTMEQSGHWQCDLGFAFDVDADFRLLRMTTRDSEVDGHPLSEPFPSEAFSKLDVAPPPRYRPPADRRFEPIEVTIEGPVPIGATLCVPHGSAPIAGVLFVKGSGRQDRHGIVDGIDTGAHAVCDFLADNGFVTLRFDARGAGTTPFGNPFEPMLAARREDTRAAWKYLSARPEVDSSRMVLVGHSLGAMIAMQLAIEASAPRTRALVLLAPPGRPLEEVLSEQARREARRLEMSAEEQARRNDVIARTLDRKAREAPEQNAQIDEFSYADAMRALRDDFRSDPVEALREVRAPVLICFGDKDIQVDVRRDGERLMAAARAAGVPCELQTYPSLDHLFRKIATEPSPADYFRELPVDHSFLEALSEWILKHT